MKKKLMLKKITMLCAKKNWSLHELTLESGLSSGMIYQWYNSTRNPSISSLENICRAFEITLSEFFSFNEKDIKNGKINKLCALAQDFSEDEIDSVINLLENFKRK